MRSAVVVGAGIGGLAVAGALARSGWQVTLLERADRVRPEPTAVVLWPNGVRALRALGLGAGLDGDRHPAARRRGTPPGRALAGAAPRPTPADRMPVVVHREDLHDALIAGLGDRGRAAYRGDRARRSAPRRASGPRSATAGTPSRPTWSSPPTAPTARSAGSWPPSPAWSAPAAPPGGR